MLSRSCQLKEAIDNCGLDSFGAHCLTGTCNRSPLLGRQAHVISIAPPVIGGITGYHAAAAHRAFQNALQDRPLPISFQSVRSPAAAPEQIIYFGPDLAVYDCWLLSGIDFTLVLHFPNVEDVGQQAHQCWTVKLLSDVRPAFLGGRALLHKAATVYFGERR